MDSATDRRHYGAHRRLLAHAFGVKLVSDIPERLCGMGVRPWIDVKRRRRLAAVRDAGILFVHVPKNAGMSISHALYGMQIKHASIRYYRRAAPELIAAVPSFAVVRDPVDRFLSAFAYARRGGSRDNRIAAPFRPLYAAFRSVDDALDHVEAARSPYAVDHVFRAQSWYLTDEGGSLAVDRLLRIDQLHADVLGPVLPPGGALPRINRGDGKPVLSGAQVARINLLYAADHDLFAGVLRADRVPSGWVVPASPGDSSRRDGIVQPCESGRLVSIV